MQASGTALKTQLKAAMTTALKAGEKKRLGVIRLMLATIKQKEIDARVDLDDSGVIAVLDKMIKQPRDSSEQFRAAGRTDLADGEDYEIVVIQEYLPQALTQEEILQLIQTAVETSIASSMKDRGRVMGLLKPLMQGRADMAIVSRELGKFFNKREFQSCRVERQSLALEWSRSRLRS
ncbi:MAG: GatB/YqeY domain-containing protein [Methylococcales bacterium]